MALTPRQYALVAGGQVFGGAPQVRRKRWNPGANARVNWSHPLARGLVTFMVPMQGTRQWIDYVSGIKRLQPMNYRPNITDDTPIGKASQSDSGAQDEMVAFTPEGAATAGISVVFGAKLLLPLNPGASGILFAVGSSLTGGDRMEVFSTGTNQIRMSNYVTNATDTPDASTQYNTIGLSHSLAGFDNYWNGNRNGSGTARAWTGDLQVSSLGRCWAGYQFFGLWNRALTAAEHAQLAADPFCFLTQPGPVRRAPSITLAPETLGGGRAGVRRKRWNPGASGKINWSHPLAQGLVYAFLPVGGGRIVDLAGGSPIVTQSAAKHGETDLGTAFVSDAATNAGAYVASPPPLGYPLSFVWAGARTGAVANGVDLFGYGYGSGGTPTGGGSSPYYTGLVTANATDQIALAVTSGSTLAAQVGTTSIPLGRNVLVGTIDTAAHSFWVNGLRVYSNALAVSQPQTTNRYLALCVQNSSSMTGIASNLGLVYNRVLSNAEIEQLTADPFCMFLDAPQRRVFSVVAPASAAPTAGDIGGVTFTATTSFVPGALTPSGAATIVGVTFAATTSFLPGALSVSGAGDIGGVTFTATSSFVPGALTASGAAAVGGVTFEAGISFLPGALAASGAAAITGVTFTATTSFIPGDLSGVGGGTIGGVVFTATTSFVPGALTASGAGSIAGVTFTATTSFVPGALTPSGAGAIAGATFAATTSFLPGAVQGAVGTIDGVTFVATTSFVPGALTATGAGTITGVTFAATTSFVPGALSSSGAGTIGGVTFTTTTSFLAGVLTASGAASVAGVTYIVLATFLPGALTARDSRQPGYVTTRITRRSGVVSTSVAHGLRVTTSVKGS